MTRPSSRVPAVLLRAGAHGALYGGQGGAPEVGLTVPLRRPGDLGVALAALEGTGTRATLLVPADWAGADLRAAAELHEIAGRGPGAHPARLDLLAGRPVTLWDPAGLTWGELRALAGRGVRLLPPAQDQPQPGQRLEVAPADLTARLPEVRARGYRPVPVREVPGLRAAGGRDLLRWAYEGTVEASFARSHGVIDLSARADGVMRVAALDHAPPPLPLPPRTPTAELHLNSARIVGLAGRGALGAYRAYQRSLRDVGAALRTRPELAGAQAVFAVTLFYGPLEQSGFALLDLPPARAWVYGLGFSLLRRVHGTARPSSAGRPRLAWMGREAFLARYG